MLTARRNALLNMLEGASFQASQTFVSSTAILPLFVAQHTDARWALGLVGAAAMLGPLAQLVGAAYTARQQDFGRTLNVQMLAPRLALVALALAPWLPGHWALVGFFALLLLFNLAVGFSTPIWLEFIHQIVPAREHGTFFGRRKALSGLASAIAMAGTSAVLGTLPQPWGFRACFALAAVIWLASFPCILRTRLPARATQRPAPLPIGQIARELLGHDTPFRRYVSARVVLAGAGMASGFYVLHATRSFGLPAAQGALFAAALTLLPALCGSLAGRWVDTSGGPRALATAATAAAVAHLVLLASPALPVAFAALFLIGFANGVIEVADCQVLLALGAARCGMAASLLNLAALPVGVALALFAGFVADRYGIPAVFLGAALAWLGGAALLGRSRASRPLIVVPA